VTAKPTVVVVGAGAGGDAVAWGLRKQGFQGSILLIGAESERPYNRPYLSKQLLRQEITTEKTFLRPAQEYERRNIQLLLNRRVVRAHGSDRQLELQSGGRIPWDVLVLATGSEPRWLPDAPRRANVFTLRSLHDGLALQTAVAGAGRVMVVGAGFIGMEVAASARQLGKEVLAVEVAPIPMGRALGEEMGQIYARLHRSRGVDLRTGVSVSRWIESDDRVRAVELSDGTREEVDLILIGIGVSPRVALAEDLGLSLGEGGVRVDEALRAAPDVFCIGDIAAHQHPVYGRPLRVEHWQVAQRQGTGVATSVAGQPEPYREIPWFWSDQYDVNLQYLGNSRDFDETITRGNTEAEKFSIFYRKDGVIQAVLSINDARTGRFSRDLISRRTVVDGRILADPDSDLKGLAASA